jgi:hypothetical protein
MVPHDCAKMFKQTKGISLEEINGKFGDEVIVYFTQISDEENAKLEAAAFEDIGRNNTVLPLKEGHISVTHQESAVKDAQD